MKDFSGGVISPTRDMGQHTTAWEGNTYMSHAEELQFAPVPRGTPPGVPGIQLAIAATRMQGE